MELGNIVKLDHNNRLHLPKRLMKEAGLEPNSEVVVIYDAGLGILRIVPKAVFDEVKNMQKTMAEWGDRMRESIEKLNEDLRKLNEEEDEEDDDDKIKVVGVQDDTI